MTIALIDFSDLKHMPQPDRTTDNRDNLKYNSVKTAGSGVRLRILDATDGRTGYVAQVDRKQ